MNEGKKFEQDFIKSIDTDHVLVKRLADNPLAFEGGGRFSTNNECDYLLFESETRTLYGLELKTTLSSLTYWREDYEDETHKSFTLRTPAGEYVLEPYTGLVLDATEAFLRIDFNDVYDFVNYANMYNGQSTFRSDITIDEEDRVVALLTCTADFDTARYVLFCRLSKVR